MPVPSSRRLPKLMGVLVIGLMVGAAAAFLATRQGDLLEGNAPGPAPKGMVWIPGGTYTMGSELKDSRFKDAKPLHEVSVTGFWMDACEVTNDQYAEFVAATGYKTVAERKPEKAEIMSKARPGAREPTEAELVPGSVVFTPPPVPVPLNQGEDLWWAWVPGAYWKQPEGPGSNLNGRGQHPVVQIAWDDAVAYCEWAGKRLPTEAEWERAARGGHHQQDFVWGSDEPGIGGAWQCNIFQGHFPDFNSKADGHERTAPVGHFPANTYGLHDMAGNVWEWCSDWYAPEYYKNSPRLNPKGPTSSADPERDFNEMRVQRGGSFLCSFGFCARYMPGGRGRGDPLTGMSHVGFRCVKDAK